MRVCVCITLRAAAAGAFLKAEAVEHVHACPMLYDPYPTFQPVLRCANQCGHSLTCWIVCACFWAVRNKVGGLNSENNSRRAAGAVYFVFLGFCEARWKTAVENRGDGGGAHANTCTRALSQSSTNSLLPTSASAVGSLNWPSAEPSVPQVRSSVRPSSLNTHTRWAP